MVLPPHFSILGTEELVRRRIETKKIKDYKLISPDCNKPLILSIACSQLPSVESQKFLRKASRNGSHGRVFLPGTLSTLRIHHESGPPVAYSFAIEDSMVILSAP